MKNKKEKKKEFIRCGDDVQRKAVLIRFFGILGCFIVGIIKMKEDVAAVLIIVYGSLIFYLVGELLRAFGRSVSCKEQMTQDIEAIREYLENKEQK